MASKRDQPRPSGRYATNDTHFAGVPKIDAPPEDILRAVLSPVTERAKRARERYLASKRP